MWGPGLGTKAAICWAGRERPGGPGQHPREPRCPPGSACNWEGRKGTTLHTAELYRNIHPHNLAGRPAGQHHQTHFTGESLHRNSFSTYYAPGLVTLSLSPSLAQQGHPAPWVGARV